MPFKDHASYIAYQRGYTRRVRNADRVMERWLERARKMARRMQTPVKQRAGAFETRFNQLVPDGDIKAFRERVKQECAQWT